MIENHRIRTSDTFDGLIKLLCFLRNVIFYMCFTINFTFFKSLFALISIGDTFCDE